MPRSRPPSPTSLRARSKPASLPETPTACALDWLSSDTSSVLILPVSTISTTFTSSRPVTRTPSTNSLLPWPSFSMVCVISGPPPCTTIGQEARAAQQVDVVREARLERVLHHRGAAVLDDGARARELADVAERLDEQRALEAGAVVGEPVVAGDRAVGRGVREARVVGVDLHVVVREIAAPRDGGGGALGEAHVDAHVRLAHLRAERERRRRRRARRPRTRTCPARARVARVGSIGQSREPTRAPMADEDAAPVRVGAEDGAPSRGSSPATLRASSRAMLDARAPRRCAPRRAWSRPRRPRRSARASSMQTASSASPRAA